MRRSKWVAAALFAMVIGGAGALVVLASGGMDDLVTVLVADSAKAPPWVKAPAAHASLPSPNHTR